WSMKSIWAVRNRLEAWSRSRVRRCRWSRSRNEPPPARKRAHRPAPTLIAMPTHYAHWCTRCGTWWGRTSKGNGPRRQELGGPGRNPARSPLRLHLDAFHRDRVLVHGARNGHLMAGVRNHLILVGNLVHLAVAHQNGRRAALDAARRAGSMVRTSNFIGCLARTRRVRDVACPFGSHRTHRTKRKHSQYFLHKPPQC